MPLLNQNTERWMRPSERGPRVRQAIKLKIFSVNCQAKRNLFRCVMGNPLVLRYLWSPKKRSKKKTEKEEPPEDTRKSWLSVAVQMQIRKCLSNTEVIRYVFLHVRVVLTTPHGIREPFNVPTENILSLCRWVLSSIAWCKSRETGC